MGQEGRVDQVEDGADVNPPLPQDSEQFNGSQCILHEGCPDGAPGGVASSSNSPSPRWQRWESSPGHVA